MLTLLLGLTLAVAEEPVSAAANEVSAATRMAEYHRLSEEIDRLARRQVWTGVTRLYPELDALGVPLDYDDYVAGALAARHQGDVLAAYERLQSAARIEGTRDVVEWLWAIDSGYGRVRIEAAPRAELQVEVMPMLPDQRAAIEFAQAELAETGVFVGMLPVGEYRLAGQPLPVVAGDGELVRVIAAEGRRGRR